MRETINGITFSSDFDSGNCDRVEAVSPKHYNLWVTPDCAGTPHETTYRTWFYFSVTGAQGTITLTVKNLNKQLGLFRNGHRPVVKVSPSRPQWEHLRQDCAYQVRGIDLAASNVFVSSPSCGSGGRGGGICHYLQPRI